MNNAAYYNNVLWMDYLQHLTLGELNNIKDMVDSNHILYSHNFIVMLEKVLDLYLIYQVPDDECLYDENELPYLTDIWIRSILWGWSKNGVDEMLSCVQNEKFVELFERIKIIINEN